MFNSIKVFHLIFFLVLTLGFLRAQKAEILVNNSQGQNYAIASAKASKSIYLIAQKTYFLDNTLFLKDNIDSLLFLSDKAIQLADSSLLVISDTSETARSFMIEAIVYQKEVFNHLVKIQNTTDVNVMSDVAEQLLYASANSCVDTYKASLYFDSNIKDDRVITRLESDEFSYLSVKELYANRLSEIDEELAKLYELRKTSEGDELIKINLLIDQLEREREKLLKKMEDSDNRLVSVRNDLNEEMLNTVDKDVFSVDKNDFYNKNVPVPVTDRVPDGLVYKLQIGFFRNKLPSTHFSGIFPISSHKIDNLYYRYVAGNFAKYENARKARLSVLKRGYDGSFIVAYLNGNKISVGDALKLEKE
jgi:hypothetical protein